MENVIFSGDRDIGEAGLLLPLDFNTTTYKDSSGNASTNATNVVPVARNCTARIRTNCNRNVGQSHSSQGLMALVVMLVVLCLLIIYCCWGGCCKLIRRRRRINRSLNSAGSCNSYPNVVVLPYRGGIYDQQDPSSRHNGVSRSRSAKDSHGRLSQLPPPPYETLFGNETCNPPSYSSVCLPALATLHSLEVPRQADTSQSTTCDHQNVSQAATGPEEPNVSQGPISGSDPVSHCVVAVAIERSTATNDLLNADHSRGSLPEATSRVPRSLSVPSSIGGSSQPLSAPSTVHCEV